MPTIAPTMAIVLLRFGLLLSVDAVDELLEPPAGDMVADDVVRVLHDNNQPHQLKRVRISKTDLDKDEEDEEDEEVLVVLEVLFVDCAYRGQRYETKPGEVGTTGTHSLFVHWKPLLVLQHLRPQHS